MSEFYFGQAQAVITPPIGTDLVGYPERDHGCEGVHDNLYAKAWVFSEGSEHVALVFLDLTGVDLELTTNVRKLVAENSDLRPHEIHLNFSHTHSGPACMPGSKNLIERMYSEDDPQLNLIMTRQIAGAILAAYGSLRKGRLGFGRGELTGLGTNRRDPAGLMDTEVKVIRVEEQVGNLAGVIVKYACHPTVLHQDNYLVSRDYPGFMCDALERAKGGGIQVAFAQGTAADASTRRTRRGTTFTEAERLGHLLAGEALRVLESIQTSDDIQVRCITQGVDLPTRNFPSPEEADRVLREETQRLEDLKASDAPYGEVRSAYVTQLGAQIRAEIARQDVPETVPSEVGFVEIGNLKIGLLPGEIFARTGLRIKDELGLDSMVLSYCNCSHGYILPPEDEAEGGYESGASLIRPEAVETIQKAIADLAKGS